MRRELHKTHSDSLKALIYINLGYSFILSNPDSLGYYAKKGYDLSMKIGFKRGEALGLIRMGQSISKINANFYQALVNYDKALRIAGEIKDPSITAKCLGNISVLYLEQNSFGLALEYAQKQKREFEKLKDTVWIIGTCQHIAEIYIEMDSIKRAEEYAEASYRMSKELYFEIDLYFKFALIRERQGRFVECDSILKIMGEKLKGQTNVENHQARFEYIMAKRKLQEGLYNESLDNAKRSVKLFTISGEDKWLSRAYEMCADAYAKQGKYQQAFDNLQIATKYRGNTYSNNVKSLTDYWSREQKQKENDFVLHEQELQLTKVNSEKKLWSVFVVFLIISTIGLAYTIRQRTRYNRSLELEKERVTKKNELLQIQQEELAAINEELHSQQEEIETQRDLVMLQKNELEAAQAIIQLKNEEISLKNLNLENEVNERTKEIVEYSKQLEQFAFISAHNLRGPVARILGLGQLLNFSTSIPEEDKIIKDKLLNTTKELDRVVRDLNTILDIRKNNTEVIVEVSLEEEIKLVQATLEKEIEETNTRVYTDFEKVKHIRVIKPYLDSIFLNLISNAIKYRNATTAPVIWVRSRVETDAICIEVQDNGLGIDLEIYQSKIFTLYSRFHDHTEGKGLGLYLVKTQMQSMGGSVEVQSMVNHGTTFTLYFKK